MKLIIKHTKELEDKNEGLIFQKDAAIHESINLQIQLTQKVNEIKVLQQNIEIIYYSNEIQMKRKDRTIEQITNQKKEEKKKAILKNKELKYIITKQE